MANRCNICGTVLTVAGYCLCPPTRHHAKPIRQAMLNEQWTITEEIVNPVSQEITQAFLSSYAEQNGLDVPKE